MAKYVPSALLGRISRSAGSTTFGHNRNGAYFRNRVIPTNPVTSAQTNVRTSFGNIAEDWRGLTEEQRDAWTAFGQNFARTDSLGETYNLTGLQAFASVNQNLFTVGGTAVLAPPLYAPPAGILTMTVTANDTPTLSMAYTATPLGTGEKLVVEATRPLSAGINFQQRGAYKQVHVSAAAAASPANILSGYTAIYGTAGEIGEKILFRAYVISSTGLASPVLTGSTIVVSAA